MIGLLLITHDAYGDALVRCAEHVHHARPPQLASLGIEADENPVGALDRARALVAEVDSGEGVLVMTDVIGATPANAPAASPARSGWRGTAAASTPRASWAS